MIKEVTEKACHTLKFIIENICELETLNDPERDLIDGIKQVSADVWFMVASWGKETGNLAGYQCGISGTLGRYVGWNKDASVKQAKQGLKILHIAYSKGFITETTVKELLEKHHSFLDD